MFGKIAKSFRGTKKTTADKTTAEAEPVGNGISPEERELAKPAMSYDHYQERVSAQPHDHQVKLEGVYATSIGTGQGRDEAERNGPTQSMSQLRNGSEKQSRSMAETEHLPIRVPPNPPPRSMTYPKEQDREKEIRGGGESDVSAGQTPAIILQSAGFSLLGPDKKSESNAGPTGKANQYVESEWAQDESEVFADNLPRMQQADISYSPSRQAQALALKVPDLQGIQAMQVSSTPSPATPPISNSSVLSNYTETDMNAHFLKAQVQNLQVELSSQNQQMNRLRDHLREREAIVLENERELALLRGKEIDKQKTEEQERSLKAKIEQYQNTILRLQDENRRHSETIWEHKQQIQRLQGSVREKRDNSTQASDSYEERLLKQRNLWEESAKAESAATAKELETLRNHNQQLERMLYKARGTVSQQTLQQQDLSGRTSPHDGSYGQTQSNLANREVVLDDHIILASYELDSSRGTLRTPVKRVSSNPGIGHHASPSDCPSKNSELQLNLELKSNTDWRGGVALPRDSKVYGVARTVVERAADMMDDLDMTQDISDSSWNLKGKALYQLLDTTDGNLLVERFESICEWCEMCLRSEPSVIDIKPPCKVFGDIHGQLRDLLLLFREFGFPSHSRGDVESMNYIFNGDFVDRGAHQLECVTLLFSLKALYPDQIILVRGNHEFREQNMSMGESGFWWACQSHFTTNTSLAQRFYDRAHQSFDWVPLAVVINHSIIVLHGGIGDGHFTVEDIRNIKRPITTWTTNRVVEHVLWSDPSDSDSHMKMGVHGSPRGETCVEFGPDVTKRFCQLNSIKMIIRAHQFVDHGYKIMHGGQLVTVFSARNYLDLQSNDSALLLIAYDAEGKMRIRPKRLMHRQGHYQPAPSWGSPKLSHGQFMPIPGSPPPLSPQDPWASVPTRGGGSLFHNSTRNGAMARPPSPTFGPQGGLYGTHGGDMGHTAGLYESGGRAPSNIASPPGGLYGSDRGNRAQNVVHSSPRSSPGTYPYNAFMSSLDPTGFF